MLGLVKTEPQMETRHCHTYILVEIWAIFTIVATGLMEHQEDFPHECKCIDTALFSSKGDTHTSTHAHTIHIYLHGFQWVHVDIFKHS